MTSSVWMIIALGDLQTRRAPILVVVLLISRSTCLIKGPQLKDKYASSLEGLQFNAHRTQEKKMADLSILAFSMIVGAVARQVEVHSSLRSLTCPKRIDRI